jgi:hypothetical protein
MAELAVQSETPSNPINFEALRAQLEPNIPAQTALIQKTYAITDPKMLMSIIEAQMEGIRPLETTISAPAAAPELANLNEQSAQSEATLVQGGFDAAVAREVEASVGVGGNIEAVKKAEAEFALQVAQAIRDGIPPDQLRFDDPTLTEAAKAAIYEQVAQQQGTTAARVEQEAKERAERDMQAVQGAVFGAAGLGLSADKGLQNLMLGANHAPEVEAVAASKENPQNPFAALLNGTGIIENLTKSFNDTSTPEQQAQSGQSQGRDGWVR